VSALPPVSYEESPVFLRSGAESLFGVWTEPLGRASGHAVTMVPGAGNLSSSHRNRMFVHLARELAGLGHHVLRVDYHGIGESTGRVGGFALDDPFTTDLMAAIAWVEAQGLTRHVLVGSCFGARTILAAAPAVGDLRAVALVSPPVRDFERGEDNAVEWNASRLLRRLRDPEALRGLLSAERRGVYRRFASAKLRELSTHARARTQVADDPVERSSPAFREPLERLVEQRTPILFYYGDADGLWHHFDRARHGDLADLIARADDSIQVQVFNGNLHNFDSLEAQNALIAAVPAWLSTVVPRG
jgi:pimeloyl-ACP methyl ester carboxylesterase